MITSVKEIPVDTIQVKTLHIGDVFYTICREQKNTLCMLIDDNLSGVVEILDLNNGLKINIDANSQVTPVYGEVYVTFRNDKKRR